MNSCKMRSISHLKHDSLIDLPFESIQYHKILIIILTASGKVLLMHSA